MATWTITDDLRVTHDSGDRHFDCGQAEAALMPEVEAWVVSEASPWDLVRTPRGLFVRQTHVGPQGKVTSA